MRSRSASSAYPSGAVSSIPEKLALPRIWAPTSRSCPAQASAPRPWSRPSRSPNTSMPSANSAVPRSDPSRGPDTRAPDNRRYPPTTALGSRTVPSVCSPSSSSRLPSIRIRSATTQVEASTMPTGTGGIRLSAGSGSGGSATAPGSAARSMRAPDSTRSPSTRAPGSRMRPLLAKVRSGSSRCRPAYRLPPMTTPEASSASPVGLVSSAPARSRLPVIRPPGSRSSPSLRSRRA